MILPKILLIGGEPFNQQTATGITLTNIFRYWPKDKIAIIYTSNIKNDATTCSCAIKIDNKNLRYIGFLWVLHERKKNKQINFSNINLIKSNQNYVSLIKYYLRNITIPIIDLFPYKVDTKITDFIEDFKPDIIYSLLGNIRVTNLVIETSKIYNLPIVPHFMDDWLSTYGVPGKSSSMKISMFILNKKVEKLMKKVDRALAISPLMAKEYCKKFKCDFSFIMNSVEFDKKYRFIRSNKKKISFVYCGGLHLSRYKTLLDLSYVIFKMRETVSLTIFSPQTDIEKYEHLFAQYGVRMENINADIVLRKLYEHDVAVHVESFDPDVIKYTRLSMSTKIPQYMAACMPILCISPKNLASYEYIKKTRTGITINSTNKDEIIKSITVLQDYNTRVKFSTNAFEVAIKEHEINEQHRRLITVFESAINDYVGKIKNFGVK